MKHIYSQMTEAQLDEALRARGINPDRTIKAVLDLVREKTHKEHRGFHHLCWKEDGIAAEVIRRTLDWRNRFHGSLAVGWEMGSKAA
jgi:hypothetical protein